VESSIAKLTAELTNFATVHAESIKTDPAFRSQFLKMCAMLNIDPIGTNQTYLGSLLGIGSYYYELALKTAEVCVATRERNGGVISVAEVIRVLERKEARRKGKAVSKGKGQGITADDIALAVSKLKCLGGGFRILNRSGVKGDDDPANLYVVSVPMELNADHVQVINISATSPLGRGCVNVAYVVEQTGWTVERTRRCIESMKVEGVCWEDVHKGLTCWWFMSVWSGSDGGSEGDD
jgi:ESCRT-II complex subunit VPS22